MLASTICTAKENIQESLIMNAELCDSELRNTTMPKSFSTKEAFWKETTKQK